MVTGGATACAGVAAVDRAGSDQCHGRGQAVGSVQIGVVEPPLRLGPRRNRSGQYQRTPTRTITSPLRGQLTESPAQPPPAATHTTLGQSWRPEVIRNVVAVGDDGGIGMPASRPQCALDVVDLTDAIQLIAGQVQQHDHLAPTASITRHVHLVDPSAA